MTGLTCTAVRRRLAEFHDGELPVQKRIALQGHLNALRRAASTSCADYEDVSSALRLAAAPGPADDWTGLRPGVIGRMRAEANEAWLARMGRMFDDMHLVWIGLASTVGHVPVRRDRAGHAALRVAGARGLAARADHRHGGAVGLEPQSRQHGRPDDPGPVGAGRGHREGLARTVRRAKGS